MLGWVKTEDRPDGFSQKELPVSDPKAWRGFGKGILQTCAGPIYIYGNGMNGVVQTSTGTENLLAMRPGTIIGVGEGVEDESENKLVLNATLHVGHLHVAKKGMPMYARMALFSVFTAMGPLPLTFAYLLSIRTNPSDLSLPLASIQDPLSAIHTYRRPS